MTTITEELHIAIKQSGHTQETIAPLIGLTGATFSLRKKGKVSWELDKCFRLVKLLNLPDDDIRRYFTTDKEDT